MASIKSKGIDFFSIDCIDDDGREFVQAKHKTEGFGLLVRIEQRIYRHEGYYCDWQEKNVIMFADKYTVSLEFLKSVVDTCLEEGIFDRKMFDEHKILTSLDIQKKWLKIVTLSKRNDRSINPLFELIEKTPEFLSKTQEEIKETPVIDIQSKVKESREKERKKREGDLVTFVPPSHADVFEFFKIKIGGQWSVKKCKDQAGLFVSHYSSSGWMRGNTKIKNWMALAEKWIMTDSEFPTKDQPAENVNRVVHMHASSNKVQPTPEPNDEEKLMSAKKLVITCYDQFVEQGHYADFGNTIYNILSDKLKLPVFNQFISGKDEHYFQEGLTRQTAKPVKQHNGAISIGQALANNNPDDTRTDAVVAGRKVALNDFFKHVSMRNIDLKSMIL